MGELYQQAIAQIARGDADRIETLHALQHRLDFLEGHVLIAQAFQNVFQRHGEITGVVHRVDDGGGDGGVGIGERRQIHLPHQVILQRLGSLALIDRQLVVAVVGAGAGRRAGGVDLIPGGVQRQLFRHVFLFQRLAGIEPLGLLDFFGVDFVVQIGLFKQRIALQRQLDLLLKLKRGQLQQADRLLELRSHGQLLAEPELQTLLHSLLSTSVNGVARSAPALRGGTLRPDKRVLPARRPE